ncbi:putative ankyrin repeat protein [Planoprotostelium fungivorum]|uniref:Putative ankyrin repeat protein n=1 Tax=Planoprotostelium fungivorum TaxID=1890364 RepID=A0A2P6NIG5_9EUKA|nr:putative ankyrin repeat protein [Planoprotostelium fungivorum]
MSTHKILESHDIQDLILQFLFQFDPNRVYPIYPAHCQCGIEQREEQKQSVESVDKLRAWKAVRLSSRRLRQVADKMYSFETVHFVDAVLNNNLPAFKFFMTRPEIQVQEGLMFASWKGNIEMLGLLVADERVVVKRSKSSNFDAFGVAASNEATSILRSAPDRQSHKGGASCRFGDTRVEREKILRDWMEHLQRSRMEGKETTLTTELIESKYNRLCVPQSERGRDITGYSLHNNLEAYPKVLQMTNGVLSNHDVTRIILEMLIRGEGNSGRRIAIARFRRTCKMWKEMGELARPLFHLILSVDTSADWLNYDDLLAALERRSVDTVRYLVDIQVHLKGDPFTIFDHKSKLKSEDVEIIRTLLKHPHVDPAADDHRILTTCIWNRDHDLVKELLADARVDLSVDNNICITEASRRGVYRITRLLLDDPRVDPSANDNEAIREASRHGHIEVVRLLLFDTRVYPAAKNNHAIYMASHHGHKNHSIRRASLFGYTKLVQLLLTDARVDPSAAHNHSIRRASLFGYTKLVQLLLSAARVDPSAVDDEAIQNASYRGHTEINNKALRDACARGHIRVIQLLLADDRVDRSAADAYVRAPIYRRLPILEMLLNHPGVDPSTDDNRALLRACKIGDLSFVCLLLADARVDPTVKDNEAIRTSSAKGRVGVVRLLLSHHRVDPSSMDNWAIRKASAGGHIGTVRSLLSHPLVDPSANNNEAVRMAAERGHKKTVRLLLTDPRVVPCGIVKRSVTQGYVSRRHLVNIDQYVCSVHQQETTKLSRQTRIDDNVSLPLADEGFNHQQMKTIKAPLFTNSSYRHGPITLSDGPFVEFRRETFSRKNSAKQRNSGRHHLHFSKMSQLSTPSSPSKDLKRKRAEDGDGKATPEAVSPRDDSQDRSPSITAKKPKDTAKSPQSEPMIRSRSIESIKKSSPERVMRVCIDRVTEILQGATTIDYKRITHWLRLADQMSKECNKEEDLNELVGHIITSHSTNTALLAVIHDAIPNIKQTTD